MWFFPILTFIAQIFNNCISLLNRKDLKEIKSNHLPHMDGRIRKIEKHLGIEDQNEDI